MRWVSSVLVLTLLGAVSAQAAPPGDKPRTDRPAFVPTTLAGENRDNRWPLSLPDAIRIALDNSELVRVVYGRLPQGTVTDQDRHDPDPYVDYQPYDEAPIGFSDNPPRKAPIPGPLMIERVKADTPIGRFRADAMALVRSVEQQYWVVAAQRVRVACAEQVVKTATDVTRRMPRKRFTPLAEEPSPTSPRPPSAWNDSRRT